MIKGDLLISADKNICAIFIHYSSNNLIFVAIPGLGILVYPQHLWAKV